MAIQRIEFEQWARLARSSSAHHERLRRLQWRIDRLREQAGNPMAACVQISNLMWTTFDRLGKAYHDPQALQPERASAPPKSATIVPFKSQ